MLRKSTWLCAVVMTALVGGMRHLTPAATQYWDVNGTTNQSGNTGGNWSDSSWSSVATGNVATVAWTAGNDAIFSAGTDGAGTWTVDVVSGANSVHNVTIEEGAVTFGTSGDFSLTSGATWGANSGASLAVSRDIANGGNLFTVNTTGPITISGVVSGGGGLTKGGTGALTL